MIHYPWISSSAFQIRCLSDRYQLSCYRQIPTYRTITPDHSGAYASSIISFSSLQWEFYFPWLPRTLYLGYIFLLGGFPNNHHFGRIRRISSGPIHCKPWQYNNHYHPFIALSPFPLPNESEHILPSRFRSTPLKSQVKTRDLHIGFLHLDRDQLLKRYLAP